MYAWPMYGEFRRDGNLFRVSGVTHYKFLTVIFCKTGCNRLRDIDHGLEVAQQYAKIGTIRRKVLILVPPII